MKKWTIDDIPSMNGRSVLITGGTSGLGYEDARALVRAGANVIITGRDSTKGHTIVDQMHKDFSNAAIRFELLDLADLSSIKAFGKRMNTKLDNVHILINNAGVMTPPKRITTKDGFELQFGANYLGHFALTRYLLPLLTKAKGRVITLSSIAARDGFINFDDLQAEKNYKPMQAYGQSKLACLIFAFELQRRSDAEKWNITSIAAHPGISRTNLLVNKGGNGYSELLRKYMPFMFQPPAQGALPSLFAAISSNAKAGAYYGPDGFRELRGYPKLAYVPEQAKDLDIASKLWEISEQLSGVRYTVNN